MVHVVRLSRIELLQPPLGGGDHLGAVVFRKLNARPAPDAVDRMLQRREQLRDRPAIDRDVLRQGPPRHGDPVDPAMRTIARWVADVVLHVSDDGVGPIGDVHGAVGGDVEVGRSEVRIGRDQEVVDLGSVRIAGVGVEVERVLLDAEEGNRVQNQEVTLTRGRKVRARENAAARHRPHRLLQKLAHAERAVAVRLHLIRKATGGIGGVLMTPVVEADSVRVGHVLGVEAELVGSRIEAVHP